MSGKISFKDVMLGLMLGLLIAIGVAASSQQIVDEYQISTVGQVNGLDGGVYILKTDTGELWFRGYRHSVMYRLGTPDRPVNVKTNVP